MIHNGLKRIIFASGRLGLLQVVSELGQCEVSLLQVVLELGQCEVSRSCSSKACCPWLHAHDKPNPLYLFIF